MRQHNNDMIVCLRYEKFRDREMMIRIISLKERKLTEYKGTNTCKVETKRGSLILWLLDA